MSSFTDFFGSTASSGAGSIFAKIKPPKLSDLGNTQNFSIMQNCATENLVIPKNIGYVLGFNAESSYRITVAKWNNTLVWHLGDGGIASGSVLNALIYNQVLDKWYLSSSGSASDGVFDVNILTGTRKRISTTVPAFMSSTLSSAYGSFSYCNSEGLYEWRNGDVIRKYNQSFVQVQNRSYAIADALNDPKWYYTMDCKIRAQPIYGWVGNGSASANNIVPNQPILLLERYGSRRIVQITAEAVFFARTTQTPDFESVSYMTPMAPRMGYGAFFGNAVRLGSIPRDTVSPADSYLLDRADYDRWLSDVCDALGMPAAKSFYGDWVNG